MPLNAKRRRNASPCGGNFAICRPTRKLELSILERILQYDSHEGWPTTVPTMRPFLSPLIPNYQDEQAVEAIKRLLSNNSLTAQEWDPVAGRFRAYSEYQGNDVEFFYKGDFRLQRTEQTHESGRN